MSRAYLEVDSARLSRNIETFRRLVGPDVILAPTVKANAYGHGLGLAAAAFVEGGADWLCVDSIEEAQALRLLGTTCPLYVFGYVPLDDLGRVPELDVRLVVYNAETVQALAALGRPVRIHLKLETGNHRQGVDAHTLVELAEMISRAPHLELEGLSSHFANIEDTTDHAYARAQLTAFAAGVDRLKDAGHNIKIRHLSNTAAALLWPEQRFEMVRIGIGAYGHWPSKETQIAAVLTGRSSIGLYPALRWCTRVAQIKALPKGSFVGYGCTYKSTHDTQIAVVPVGYADGYDRGLSNLGYVLIRGQRAPIRGRVCMNMFMVDVTDVSGVSLEDEVVLLGSQGDEDLTAEQLASWTGTIQYEVLARIGAHLPRRSVRCPAPTESEPHAYRAPRGV